MAGHAGDSQPATIHILPQRGAPDLTARRADDGPSGAGKAAILLPGAGFVAAAYTAMCCLGVSAAVSLATTVGATAMTRDSTLEPVLVAALAVTVIGSALVYARTRRRPVALLLTIGASVWIYAALYGPLAGGSGESHAAGGRGSHEEPAVTETAHDVMAVADTGSHGSGGSTALVWIGLAVLLVGLVLMARKPSAPGRHAAHGEDCCA